MPIEPLAQLHNITINMQKVNIKTELALKRLAKRGARKTTTAVKKTELVAAKKANTIATKLKKVKATKKYAIEKTALKAKANMKKFDNRVVKNFYNTMKKSQITKYKVILLIKNGNAIKKCQSNRKTTNTEEKPENKPKIEKKPTD